MLQNNFLTRTSVLAFLLCCVSVVWQAPATFAQTGQSVEELKKKAAELTKQLKYTEALPVLEMLLIAEPDNAETNFQLGFSLVATAGITKDEAARKALRIRGRNAFIRAKELGIGIQEPVIDALILTIPPDGSDGRAFSQNVEANKLMLEAEGFLSQGKLDDALKRYQKALQLDPVLYDAALFSGDVFLQRGDFAKAELWYQKAIAINPDRETAYRYSATPLMKQQKYDQALQRYVEAYISEPYNKYSIAGLTRWANETNTRLAHPEIDVPAVDENGEVQTGSSDDASAGDKDDGSLAWVSYASSRLAWQKEKFAKTFPEEKTYRHSLAEEAEALRSAVRVAHSDKKLKTISPSVAALKKLDDEGLLEAYILIARADAGIAQDHAAYLKQNRDRLRRYVIEYVTSARSSPAREPVAGKKKFKHDETIESEYDKTSDTTTLRIQRSPITCVSGACIFFMLKASFPGSKPQGEVDQFEFALIILTKTLEPFAVPRLAAMIDGELLELGTMTFAGQASKDGLVGMGYGVILDKNQVAKLARGRKVAMRLGSLQFPLGEDKVNAIADFYDRATQP